MTGTPIQHQAQQHKSAFIRAKYIGKLCNAELKNVFSRNRVAHLQQNVAEMGAHLELQQTDRQKMRGCQHNADREAELKIQSARFSTSECIQWVWHKYPPPLRFEQNQFGGFTGATKEDRGLVRKALLYYHSDKYTMYDDRVKIIASAVCQILPRKL